MFTPMKECPTCGFPLDRHERAVTCPKCDEDLGKVRAESLMTVDVAHRGETRSDALRKLEKAISDCLWNGHSGLKVIHGHGSTTGQSSLRPHVIALMRRHAERFGGVVREDGQNPGAHILWFQEPK